MISSFSGRSAILVTSLALIIHVTDVTLHCAISHQVPKSINKIEERRSKNILDLTLKVATCKNSRELTNSSKELCLCVALVLNKYYWNFFELFIHVMSVRDLTYKSSRPVIFQQSCYFLLNEFRDLMSVWDFPLCLPSLWPLVLHPRYFRLFHSLAAFPLR